MSTDKPFLVGPGYEYLQGKQAVGIKSHELEWWHNAFQAWEELHGSIVIPRWSNEWFRRKLPAPQPKGEWVRFADKWPPSLYYPVWVWSAEVQYYGKQPIVCVSAEHAKMAFATHWMKAELPAPPPDLTQAEKDREAEERHMRSCNWIKWTATHPELLAFRAGIQHGRKSK